MGKGGNGGKAQGGSEYGSKGGLTTYIKVLIGVLVLVRLTAILPASILYIYLVHEEEQELPTQKEVEDTKPIFPPINADGL